MREELERIIRLLEREIGFYYPESDPMFRKCMENAAKAQDRIIFNILNQEGSDVKASTNQEK